MDTIQNKTITLHSVQICVSLKSIAYNSMTHKMWHNVATRAPSYQLLQFLLFGFFLQLLLQLQLLLTLHGHFLLGLLICLSLQEGKGFQMRTLGVTNSTLHRQTTYFVVFLVNLSHLLLNLLFLFLLPLLFFPFGLQHPSYPLVSFPVAGGFQNKVKIVHSSLLKCVQFKRCVTF